MPDGVLYVTNAMRQGEDSEVRERVHVSTMEASSGDDLYSVFSLEYKVDPPYVICHRECVFVSYSECVSVS